MPIYTYKCEKCNKEIRKIRNSNQRNNNLECSCGGSATYVLPKIEAVTVMETRDRYRNKQVRNKIEERVRKRAKDHSIENEISDLISEHGVEQGKRMGWIKKDGKRIRKIDTK